jgi:hypothetical protein
MSKNSIKRHKVNIKRLCLASQEAEPLDVGS